MALTTDALYSYNFGRRFDPFAIFSRFTDDAASIPNFKLYAHNRYCLCIHIRTIIVSIFSIVT